MKIAGLFAGIGGFELGLHRAGHRTSLLCEIRPGAQAVLRRAFPGVRLDPDVRSLGPVPRDVDLVCAGFPCQDLSQAGRTSGLAGEQSGLISAVFDVIRTRRIRPTLLIENVPFMLQLHGGAAMRAIVDNLEALGYNWAYRVVDSYSFGLPQRRERVFLVASMDIAPEDVLLADDEPLARPHSAIGSLAHGFYWTEGRGGLGWAVDSVPTLKNGSTIGIASPPAVLLPDLSIVTPSIRDVEAMQGFERGWTAPAEAVERASARWSLVGSAVSVPVAEWIGRRLDQPGDFEAIDVEEFPVTGKVPRAALGGSRIGRWSVKISSDPVGIRGPRLATFLEAPAKPLSAKATAGFYSRATDPGTRLRFENGFLEAVRAHRDRMLDQMPANLAA
jgi:DNA (cytosine-5)-methyltransferase 1